MFVTMVDPAIDILEIEEITTVVRMDKKDITNEVIDRNLQNEYTSLYCMVE